MGFQASRVVALVVVALAASGAAGCEDRSPKENVLAAAKRGPAPAELAASAPAPALTLPAASGLVPSLVTAPEGAESAEAVFARAQIAIEKRDYVDLVYSIRPETRRRWTRDLATALALASVDDGTDPDLGRRRAKAAARRLLETFGATARVEKRGDLGVVALEDRLFEHVRDPDGLLAAMLLFAETHDCEFDPLCALEPTGLDGIARPDESRAAHLEARGGSADAGPLAKAREASVPASGVARLLGRVRAPHRLGKVEGEVGLTEAPGFFPVRFHAAGPITWLDES